MVSATSVTDAVIGHVTAGHVARSLSIVKASCAAGWLKGASGPVLRPESNVGTMVRTLDGAAPSSGTSPPARAALR
jgi:hypothetical protein